MTPPSDSSAVDVIAAYCFGFVGGFFASVLLDVILSWVGVS